MEEERNEEEVPNDQHEEEVPISHQGKGHDQEHQENEEGHDHEEENQKSKEDTPQTHEEQQQNEIEGYREENVSKEQNEEALETPNTSFGVACGQLPVWLTQTIQNRQRRYKEMNEEILPF
ncbi:hypothetical protein SUGI_0063060 [Cryptomeria japonica]|nr:hypothetical protein SUGI_0063060 [Cryptomeria japonica]